MQQSVTNFTHLSVDIANLRTQYADEKFKFLGRIFTRIRATFYPHDRHFVLVGTLTRLMTVGVRGEEEYIREYSHS